MLQLQIPFKVTVLIGEQYAHDTSALRMMALGRRNTSILEHPYNFAEVCATADVILCASGYMPYEVAVMGIPCVVLAQNDFETELAFPERTSWLYPSWAWTKSETVEFVKRHHGTLLHEPLRKKAIARQTALGLGDGKDAVCEAIRYYLEYPKRKLVVETRKRRLPICYSRGKDGGFSA